MLRPSWAKAVGLDRTPPVFCVREPHARWPRRERHRFARTQRQIEQTALYQQDLAKLAELAAQLRAELPPGTDVRWLELEEALLSHTARLARIYYRAGFAQGAASARREASRASAALLQHLAGVLRAFVKGT